MERHRGEAKTDLLMKAVTQWTCYLRSDLSYMLNSIILL